MLRKIWIVATALGLGLVTPAMAQQSGLAVEAPDLNNFAGLALGAVPDYFGSDDYTVGVAPTARIQIGNGHRNVKLLAAKLSAILLDNRNREFGPSSTTHLAAWSTAVCRKTRQTARSSTSVAHRIGSSRD